MKNKKIKENELAAKLLFPYSNFRVLLKSIVPKNVTLDRYLGSETKKNFFY